MVCQVLGHAMQNEPLQSMYYVLLFAARQTQTLFQYSYFVWYVWYSPQPLTVLLKSWYRDYSFLCSLPCANS